MESIKFRIIGVRKVIFKNRLFVTNKHRCYDVNRDLKSFHRKRLSRTKPKKVESQQTIQIESID